MTITIYENFNFRNGPNFPKGEKAKRRHNLLHTPMCRCMRHQALEVCARPLPTTSDKVIDPTTLKGPTTEAHTKARAWLLPSQATPANIGNEHPSQHAVVSPGPTQLCIISTSCTRIPHPAHPEQVAHSTSQARPTPAHDQQEAPPNSASHIATT